MCLFKDFSLSHWFLAICAKCALIFFVYLDWGLLSYVDLTVFNRFGHFSAIIFSEIFLPPLILFLQLQCVKLFDPWVQGGGSLMPPYKASNLEGCGGC